MAQKVSTIIGGHEIFYPGLKFGAQKVSDPRFSPQLITSPLSLKCPKIGDSLAKSLLKSNMHFPQLDS